jgi:tryptophan halogenase
MEGSEPEADAAGRIRRVVILGGGTAGWMTATALARTLGRRLSITLLESDEIGIVGVGEATIPTIHWFNQLVGLDEAEFLRATKATFKLGIEFVDWARPGHRYLHPFGQYGIPLPGVAFQHRWLKARAEGLDLPLTAFSLATRLALDGRFARPASDPRSVLSTLGYAYHFDASLYARYLRGRAEADGVTRVEGRLEAVERHPETGFVTALTTSRGDRLAGDLFIDCSGFRALLIEGALGAGWEDWSHWLPCDRAWAVPCSNIGPIGPYTRATALEAGWAWRIPLTHRAGNGHVFASAFTDEDTARERLVAQLDAPPLAEPRMLRFTAGKRRRQWVGNSVAIGLAAGFLEPLESTSIHLAQLGIERLLDLFPTPDWDPIDAAEFNRLMDAEYDRVRDFIVLHYCATERDDTPFWRHVRTMALPDTLAAKMELWRARAAVVNYREGMFLEPSWLAVYLGQRVRPRGHDPRATGDGLPGQRAAVERTARAMPSHADALGRAKAA